MANIQFSNGGRGQRFSSAMRSFFSSPWTVYGFGLVIAIAASLIELLRGRAENYMVFRDATIDFWHLVNPYTDEFVQAHGRYYIYSPVFTLFFAPFAFVPRVLGGLLWNLVGYHVFFFAVRALPSQISERSVPMLWFLLLFVAQSIFPFQYNVLVTCFFLLAFILLVADKPFWAVCIIMFCAVTKIYGIFELALLLCYPKFWRNIGYAILWALIFLALPVVRLGFDHFVEYYQYWFDMLSVHQVETGPYFSIPFAWPFGMFMMPYMRFLQAGSLAVLGIIFLCCYKRWSQLTFRVGALATLMGWIVLFSDVAEFTTYTIAVTGYALWYFSFPVTGNPSPVTPHHSPIDKVLFWSIFVLFGVMPIDLFCPSFICRFVHLHLWIGVYVFAIAWIRILYTTLKNTNPHE